MKTPWLNYAVVDTEEEAKTACDRWIGGGIYQQNEKGGFNCFSLNELKRKIEAGEFEA